MKKNFLKIFVVGSVFVFLMGSSFTLKRAEANLFTDWWGSFKSQFNQEEKIEKSEPILDKEEGESEEVIIDQKNEGGILNKIFGSDETKKEEVSLYKPAVDYENAVVGAVEKADPAVVSIVVSKDLPVIENCPADPFSGIPQEFRQYFEFPDGFFSKPCQKGTVKKEVGGGSGFIVTSDGLIITNKHVVYDEGADYTVLTNDGKKLKAKVLAQDPVIDLAVLKVSESGLSVVSLGDSDKVKLGQTAIAIGNALGEFRNTVSVGVVSGLSRTITASNRRGSSETIEGVFQTDAAINSGNSGGPLLNLKGEVIGINVATASGAQNIGFAIPINMAKKSIESVKISGKISVPYIGVRYIIVDDQVASENNLPFNYGAWIKGNGETAVLSGAPADNAGVKEGDLILEVGGEKINENNSLASLVRKHEVGERVGIKISREAKILYLYPVLGGRE